MPTTDAREALERALSALGITLEPERLDSLLAYTGLLVRHGEVHNLVGTTDPARVASELVADSLAALPLLDAHGTLIDVGAGAGLPGLPLAIARPDLHAALVEPRRKRKDILNAARRTLGLRNVTVRETNVETITAEIASGERPPFDVAVSRAVFAPVEWVERGLALVRPGGAVLAWMSEAGASEACTARPPDATATYELPGLDARIVARWKRPPLPAAGEG